MNLVRFEPWSLADLVGRDLHHRDRRTTTAVGTDWTPAVDIVEKDDRFVIRADVPGIEAADLDVSTDDGVLTIAGERPAEDRDPTEGTRRYERAAGRFRRSFTLPDTVDAAAITARCRNGILQIEIPKQPAVQARRITIDAA
jgi:HSP20 family protein